MANTTQPESPAPTAADAAVKPTLVQKLTRWLVPIALLISGGLGLVKFFTPVLPSCGSEQASTSLKNIFKSKDVELSLINDFKTLSDTSAEKTCQAHVDAPSEEAIIDYRIFWEGKEGRVLITNVNAKPK